MSISSIQSMENKYAKLPIKDYCIKSSYNSATTGKTVNKKMIQYVLSRGCRFLDFVHLSLFHCTWTTGLGSLGLESWDWNLAFGVLGLDSWIWTPGLNLLPEVIKPMIWSLELQILGSPPRQII